jgi:tRNA (uracil-5-)-methyltransferase TRM9
MKPAIAKKLIEINNEFYRTVAPEFSGSRNYPWDGWKFLISRFQHLNFQPGSVLDLGCGNGRFSKVCYVNFPKSAYLGIDNNEQLLKIAAKAYPKAKFKQADIFKNWQTTRNFDLIVAFGVMHHLPGEKLREQFLEQISRHLSDDGYVVMAFWNFMKIPALVNRFVDWEKVAVKTDELDPGDQLLDWRRGPGAYRYCHQYTAVEITNLFSRAGLKVVTEFKADGPGNDVNSYYLLKKINL